METFTSIGLYSIKDKAADEFGPPFQAKTDAVAVRMFKQLLQKEQVLGLDYALFYIGSFDPVEGRLCQMEVRLVMEADVVENAKRVFPNAKEIKDYSVPSIKE